MHVWHVCFDLLGFAMPHFAVLCIDPFCTPGEVAYCVLHIAIGLTK
jgi:hypothetical protein